MAITITAPEDFEAIPIVAELQAPWFRTLAGVAALARAGRYAAQCVADAQSPAFVDCSGLYFAYFANGLAPLSSAAPITIGGTARPLGTGRERPLAGDDCDQQPGFFDGVTAGSEDKKNKRPFGSTPNPYNNTGKNDAWNQWQAGYAAGYVVTSPGPSSVREQPLALREVPRSTPGACPLPPLPPPPPAVPAPTTGSTGSAGAIDPNDKSGPTGSGAPGRHLRVAGTLAYQIAFENLPTAGLPAAEVVVIDQLDPARYDLSTLSLGSITWGPHRIDVPPGLSAYATIHPIDATMSLRVAGSLNPTTGLLKWTFTTIDPATRLPPSDPTLGFLPPNRNGTEGQGYVNFTIKPKSDLPDGTTWENFASIVFDANAPIVTPTWVNTLDTTAPTSRVDSATAVAGQAGAVDVLWSGTDGGSGVARYTVYVSDNGGAYAAWQTDVATTSARFTGTVGHTYAFHAVATDAAGNVEAAKTAAEATVTVRDPAGGGGGGGCTIGDSRDAGLVLLLAAALVALSRRRAARLHRTARG